MTSLRVNPSEYAQNRAIAREKAIALKHAAVESQLTQSTFKPEIFTKGRSSLRRDQPKTFEDQVQEQMKNSNPEERPLPTTLQRLNINNGADVGAPVVIDSLNAAMKAEKAPKSPVKKGTNHKHPDRVYENTENNNNVGIYFPRESIESLELNGKVKRGPTQAESDSSFQLSLRAEKENYNIDAVVPMGVKTASLRAKAKGGLALRRDHPAVEVVPPEPEGPADEEKVPDSPVASRSRDPITPKSGESASSSRIPTPTNSSGKRRGHHSERNSHYSGSKNRPNSAATSNTSPEKSLKPSSGEKSKLRSRLSLLKSKMPRRRSESAQAQSRPTVVGDPISPKAGAKERRRASLSAAVSKFHDKLNVEGQADTSLDREKIDDNTSTFMHSMRISASESQLQFNEHLNQAAGEHSSATATGSSGASINGRKNKGKGPIVHKAAKVDRPTLRPRREDDCEGFDPVTGEPFSPTIRPKVSAAAPTAAPSSNVNDKKNKEDYSNAYKSIEIHHKELADKLTVPQIFLDLPPDAFEEGAGNHQSLLNCPHCDRKFCETALSRHAKICQTVFLEKPKVFNSSRMRISALAKENKPDNTEMMILESAVNVGKGTVSNSINSPTAARLARKQKKAIEAKKARAEAKGGKLRRSFEKEKEAQGPKWKQQSNALRKAMLEARGKNTDHLPDFGDMDVNSSGQLTPCPHCSRKFNVKAAERHIPQCQNIKAKPTTLKKNTGMAAVAKAIKDSGKKLMTRII